MIALFCPNFKNKDVEREFNELVDVVGENAAYYLWSANNGYSLDKAPNGASSKLFSDLLSHYNGDRRSTILAKAKTLSEGFKTWFEGSKVVDENGEPMVVYHHTDEKFSSFDLSKFGKHDQGDKGVGFYFSYETNPYFTESYGDIVMPCYLRITNPFIHTGE
jgi:hypothetical protein